LKKGNRGSNLLEAFPTNDQKAFARGEIKKMPSMIVYTYWTDFDRREPTTWQILKPSEFAELLDNVGGSAPGFWRFETNITPDDFDYLWSEAQTRRFLIRMWDVYRYRKVDHANSNLSARSN
jgi:hypothetical protein